MVSRVGGGGGNIPKIEGEGGHAYICTGLKGALKGKLGVMQTFSEIIKKPLPPTHKKRMVLILINTFHLPLLPTLLSYRFLPSDIMIAESNMVPKF